MKKVRLMTHQIVTANRLHDGAVVYLAKNNDWTRNIESGLASKPTNTGALMETAERAVQDQFIIAPYLVDVEVIGNSVRPLRFREQIRAKGPSIFAPAAE
jgi:sulfite reductase (NADPH) hemoprotein beta-component